ncbi:MAG: tRNA 2-thiouridine(34) synthase MnmA [Candidatus Paraimprobicoccus trichonymphae]|uniref:tRNA-specific 2-thiouridylase MnmA n=1 Tax=Candidatus Paraimprobicoccus trichonymphae TaxID=3033793 RepID=A0AA48KXJ1_9FIRM|nr:MAG: tRNA 2-thiouridine(34) synthase MnmA [Candidatus Paraimprobicoccus trichonymphae]
MSKQKKILIAMSGGLDSSVSAYLIKNLGYQCTGVTMKLFEDEDNFSNSQKTCCSISDVEDARNVANLLDIPYYVFNFKNEFKQKVIKKFINDYEIGLTPNPCIDCNRYIKFGKLLEKTQELDFNYIATGHYARIEYDICSNRYLLKKAIDKTKDQSYFLYSMTQKQLSKTIFPLENLEKTYVKEIARKNNFLNYKKKDSQDICFVQNKKYFDFIKNNTKKSYKNGNFIDKNNCILGKHKNHICYTIGQRKGLGISFKEPLYVVSKKYFNNTITLGIFEELFSKSLEATNINLISCENLKTKIKAKAKIRYNQEEQPCLVEQVEGDKLHVEFEKLQKAITPGQAVVIYQNDIVIGGGTIMEFSPN